MLLFGGKNQRDREEEGEMKICRWRLIVTKLKAKFIPPNFELELFKSLQNLKQKDMTMKDYIEKFHKLTIHLVIENCQKRR